jgi:nicotinamide mononucleotide transporter
MMRALVADLRAMSLAELVAMLLALAYLLLAYRRSRWCWVAGGVSSAIFIVLAARARLPMQAALQVYYVLMSVYGFQHWSRNDGARAITTWPLRFHLAACAGIAAASLATARFLQAETQAAWPYLDSLTTWGSLFTTWLVARVKLENWIYWFVIDTALAFLFAAQKLYLFALLSVVYLGIVVAGYLSWLKSYRMQRALA